MKSMLIGVGNRLSHDDGVGPEVARALENTDWIAIDCGTSFENVTGLVSRERPDLLVVVDAAAMGTSPGSVFRLTADTGDRMLASTHGLPLSFVLGHLRAAARDTILIGIEPGDLTFGEGLSPAVRVAADRLIDRLRAHDLDSVPQWVPRR